MCLREVQAQDAGQRYQKLLDMVGVPRVEDMQTAARLMPALGNALGAVPAAGQEELAALLRKEQLNSYGVQAPHNPSGQRQLRGSGLYSQGALINHECNPNVARFDAFDGFSVRMSFRAMHDLPPGTELTQSYCPLNWTFEERQQQCREVYGFACNCSRCQTEAQGGHGHGSDGSDWLSEDDEDDGMEEGAGAEQGQQQDDTAASMDGAVMQPADAAVYELPPNPDEGPLDPSYLHLFLLKYMCPVPSCFGTLAPLAPDQGTADVYECNVCGARRTEAQFMQELEQSM